LSYARFKFITGLKRPYKSLVIHFSVNPSQ
jgi:hypothetical protein